MFRRGVTVEIARAMDIDYLSRILRQPAAADSAFHNGTAYSRSPRLLHVHLTENLAIAGLLGFHSFTLFNHL